MFDFRLCRQAFGFCAGIGILAGCGGSQQPVSGAPSTGVQPATRFQQQSLNGYYLAKISTVVGNGLPGSSLCFRFKPNGSWSSTGSASFTGTYLTSGKDLFAAAIWLPSPAVFLSFQGIVSAKKGSGKYTSSGQNAAVSGGGTFTLTAAQKGCS
jgi:hypothetical protein